MRRFFHLCVSGVIYAFILLFMDFQTVLCAFEMIYGVFKTFMRISFHIYSGVRIWAR